MKLHILFFTLLTVISSALCMEGEHNDNNNNNNSNTRHKHKLEENRNARVEYGNESDPEDCEDQETKRQRQEQAVSITLAQTGACHLNVNHDEVHNSAIAFFDQLPDELLVMILNDVLVASPKSAPQLKLVSNTFNRLTNHIMEKMVKSALQFVEKKAQEAGIDPLWAACKYKSFLAVQHYIKKNPELVHSRDKEGRTPLIYAAQLKAENIAQLLIEHGADVNATDTTTQSSALMWAALYGSLDTMRMLFARGAQVNTRNRSGTTPLMRAIYLGGKGSLETVKVLVEEGKADVNFTDAMGTTPLVSALAHRTFVDIAEYLLQHGADVTIPNNNGQKASDFARAGEKKALLEKYSKSNNNSNSKR